MTKDSRLFGFCLAASLALHASFVLFLGFFHPASIFSRRPVEIDLTQSPFLGTGLAKLGSPKPLAPHPAPGPAMPIPRHAVMSPQVEQKTQETPAKLAIRPTPQAWSVVKPGIKITPPPTPPAAAPPSAGGAKGGTGTSPLKGGSGTGANYGTPHGSGNGGAALLRLPQLLNRDEVLANLRRFYPEAERRAGKEGSVLLNLHIGTDGKVNGTDVVVAAAPDFDVAAQKVAALMLFSPALSASGPVAVVIRQEMVFQLER